MGNEVKRPMLVTGHGTYVGHPDGDIPYRRETVCQWQKVSRSKWAKSTCQAGGRIHERAIVRQWHYCPYCGGKIEIMEGEQL